MVQHESAVGKPFPERFGLTSREEREGKHDAAIWLHELGLCVHPVALGKKKPLKKWRHLRVHGRRNSITSVDRWFSRWNCDVGIICGKPSGCVVAIDFDLPGCLEKWQLDYPDFAAKLPAFKTTRDGQVLARGKDMKAIRRLTDKKLCVPFDWGEFRAEVMTVVPPSRLSDGSGFRTWIGGESPDEIPVVEDFVAAGLFPEHEYFREGSSHKRSSMSTNVITFGIPPVGDLRTSSARTLATLPPEVRERIEEAKWRTIPRRAHTRHFSILSLAREWKAIPEMAAADPETLRDVLFDWYLAALPNITTRQFEVTLRDFFYAWPRVIVPKGGGAELLKSRLTLESPTGRLLELCGILQGQVGAGNPFPLDQTWLGEKLLDCSQRHAGRLIKGLIDTGEIRRIERGNNIRHRASTYVLQNA